jgi:hypothetical protein
MGEMGEEKRKKLEHPARFNFKFHRERHQFWKNLVRVNLVYLPLLFTDLQGDLTLSRTPEKVFLRENLNLI